MRKYDFVMGYESPEVEVIEVEVEKGFATSDPSASIPEEEPIG